MARRAGAIEEELALARVTRERCRALELRARLVVAAELGEEVAAHGRQEVISPESRLGDEGIDERQAFRGAKSHPIRDPLITPPHGRRRKLAHRVAEPARARPD